MGATFINLDLLLEANFDLRPLANALEANGLFALGEATFRGGSWRITLQSGGLPTTPEQAATHILTAIEELEDLHRISWEGCTSRCLDFGYQGCDEPFESSFSIGHDLLARIAGTGAKMAMTIYRGGKPGPKSANSF